MDYSDTIRTITRIEAIESLLKTAVDLFFEDGDILAIHALSSAAHEVLHDLLEVNGKQESLLKDNPSVTPEGAKEYYKNLREAQNFLKHADRDPEATLRYSRIQGELWLFDAIRMYKLLTGYMKYRRFGLYTVWFHVKYKQLLRANVIEQYPKIKDLDPELIKTDYKSLINTISWPAEFSMQ